MIDDVQWFSFFLVLSFFFTMCIFFLTFCLDLKIFSWAVLSPLWNKLILSFSVDLILFLLAVLLLIF
uniref:NADH dehydrogenase subunit 5 n=1 Tax=Lutzomyia longipalpis TaxID=7200 RepID=A0A7G3B5A0_LUTLO